MTRRRTTVGKPRDPYSMRLGGDERWSLEAAASARGVPLGTYIRETALDRARVDLGVELHEPDGVEVREEGR